MKIAPLILLPVILSGCLTGGVRWGYERAKGRQASDPLSCIHFAHGQEPVVRPSGLWIAFYSIAVPSDIYIIHALSIANPTGAWIYFLIGFPMIAAENPPPYVHNTWCGPISDPANPPFEFKYLTEYTRENETCELTEDKRKRYWLLFRGEDPERAIRKDMKLSLPEDAKISFVGTPKKGICVYSLHFPGGQSAWPK